MSGITCKCKPLFMNCREQRQMKEGGGGGEDILWTHCARDGRGGQVTRLLWRTIWCNCCHGCDPVTEVDEEVGGLPLTFLWTELGCRHQPPEPGHMARLRCPPNGKQVEHVLRGCVCRQLKIVCLFHWRRWRNLWGLDVMRGTLY